MLHDQDQLLQALADRQLITADAAAGVRSQAAAAATTPEELLTRDGQVPEATLAAVKAELLGLPLADIRNKPVPRKVLELIPVEVAENYQMIAFAEGPDQELHVGLVDPQNFKAMEAVEFLAQKSNLRVRYFLLTPTEFEAALRQYHQLGEEAKQALSSITEEAFIEAGEIVPTEKMEEVIKSAPVSKMVLVIMRHAIDGRASDIHIEPTLKDTRVRYRIDGILRTTLALPKYIHSAIVARIKVLSSLKLDETRIPQDGRIRLTIEGRDVDFRISTLPVAEGEKVVLRVLDTTTEVPTLEQLGLHPLHIEMITKSLSRPHGLLLLTGPTGSGKTTTLYTILTMLNKEGSNIITLEDPIEYYIQGVNQSQINPEVGHTFATGLRAILRQDPNIIMLGEIRDSETTQLVVHASLTGHLVFSTLHTNNAVGSFGRLVDLGAEPFLLSSVMNLVMAQRLARKICPDCKTEETVPAKMISRVKDMLKAIPAPYLAGVSTDKLNFWRGKGCSRCADLGYRGRVAAAEVITITPKLRELINQRVSTPTIEKELSEQQFITLTQDCLLKALQGVTTLEEVLRVSQD